jgi:hypothetical protein
MTLQDYLGHAYAAQMMGRGKLSTIVAEFQAAAAGDPGLMAAGRAMLAGLTDDICDRDVISKCHRNFLKAATA